jgi:hypothetical protein
MTAKRIAAPLIVALAVLAFTASSASAGEPWWHLTSGSSPANLPPEGRGEIVLAAANLGDAGANGGTTPVTITDTLPAGLKAVAIRGVAGEEGGGPLDRGPVKCPTSTEVKKGAALACAFAGVLPPYEQIRIFITVEVQEGASSGEVNRAGVSGGGAQGAAVWRPLTLSDVETKFGVENYEMTPQEEGGAPDMQAGSHPFQLTTTLALNQTSEPAKPPALDKDLHFILPPGLLGNPTVFPQCTVAEFLEEISGEPVDKCPADTALGVALVRAAYEDNFGQSKNVLVKTVPLFNITPSVGEPARFGFFFEKVPVYLDTSVRTGSDYGVTVSVDNITQAATFISSQVTLWGVPGAASHDNSRGWSCIDDGTLKLKKLPPCTPDQEDPPPFLVLPTSCTGPLQTSVEADSWKEAGVFQSFPQNPSDPLPALDGCNDLPFSPSVSAVPDVQEASKPSGLKVDVHVPQTVDLDSEGLSASDVKNIVVTLPEGLNLNPSAADGLAACPLLTGTELGKEEREGREELEGINLETPQPANCPNASKIANVTIHSPLLPNPLTGFVYLAAPQNFAGLPQNPFSKHVAQYLVAHDPVSGTLVKLAGSVELGGEPGVVGLQPGQIRSTFADQPQLPFEDAELDFFGGERAPLATPAHCGSYTTKASFAPWSGNEPEPSEGQFAITSGPGGGACPGSALPFNATLSSGSTNVNAGSFSELTTTLSRPNGNQNLQSVTLHYPPGLTGLLSGVKLCGEAQANAGTCGPESQIGETIVSVGVGGEPFTVTGGKVFITGPYNGSGSCTVGESGCAPFGLSIINPAKAGPFDLQQGRPVVVRAKIEVNPLTAALTVTTDATGPYAIPDIIEGFPLQIQHVNVLVNRPGFTINPTDCDKTQVTGTMTSAEGASASISTPFQVTNCAALKFTPEFTVSTSGKTSKANGADLVTKVTEPNEPQGSQANITKVKVELPLQLPSRLTTLQKACTAAQFEANPAACPAESKIGYATVHTPLLPVPLTGPAIFVSHGGEAFPSLTMVLQGYGVTIDLVGTTYISPAGITSTTFKTVPDQPFSTFELTLPAGPYSALTTNLPHESHDLCGQKLTMPTEFVAQNGAEIHEDTTIGVTGCAPAIYVVSHKVKGKTATIAVSVPAAGKLVATGKGFSKASKTAKGATTLTLKLTLTNGETAFLAKHKGRRLKANVNVQFAPKNGAKLKTSTTVVIG